MLNATPEGHAKILATFGTAGTPLCHSGVAKLPEQLLVGGTDKHITKFYCHAFLAENFEHVFARIHAEGLWPKLVTFDGCFNNRPQKGGTKLSTHAWGISVDLNAATNALGTSGDMDARVVEIFKEEGFVWGGEFGRPDPMHFQYARKY